MPGSYFFVIVGRDDKPLFEADYNLRQTHQNDRYLNQFIAHSALDLVEDQMWKSYNSYFKSIDRFNEFFVSAFVTASAIKFIMVHDVKNDDGIRHFFNDIYETYIKHIMNPFYEMNSPINTAAFQRKAQICGKRYLSV